MTDPSDPRLGRSSPLSSQGSVSGGVPPATGASQSASNAASTSTQQNADRFTTIVISVTGLARTAIPWVFLLLLAPFAVQIAQAFAGKQTQASFALSLMASKSFGYAITAIFGGGGIGYGIIVQRIYKKRLAELATHLCRLESVHDPQRSTSGLTSMGSNPTL